MVSSNTNVRTSSAPTQPLYVGVGANKSLRFADAFSHPLQWDVATVVLQSLLDRTHDELAAAGAAAAVDPMTELFTGLSSLRSTSNTEDWSRAITLCRSHPVLHYIHQEPFTRRCFDKPRGYAGDAVMIDYIYNRDCMVPEAGDVTAMGEQLFGFIRDTPACAAVRARRDLVATTIDEVCARTDRPRILSVACGHLREAGLAPAVHDGRVGELVALDADALSLEVVESSNYCTDVRTVCSSIKGLFRGELAGEKFDFIYSTGLYDYLDDRMAAKLTHRMFQMLRPGGRLLVANFLRNIWCAGYMETFMDWKLIYRDSPQMEDLKSLIDPSEIADSRTFIEDNDNIIFLDVTRT